MPRYAQFEVILSKAHTEVVEVEFTTLDGTAKSAEGDYVPLTGTVTFAVGEISQLVNVEVRASDEGLPLGSFSVVLSDPVKGTLGTKKVGVINLPGTITLPDYLTRFEMVYDALHDPANQYFGPQAGPAAQVRSVPKHIAGTDSIIINEAPDSGSETVSETASFWVGLEAWKGYVSGERGTPSWAGYNNSWSQIEKHYIPSKLSGNMAVYDPSKPADFIPNANSPNLYPGIAQLTAVTGDDPLWDELQIAYNNPDRMFLMHWILDVEGAYGFHNRDKGTKNVFINTYQRGLQESSFETVTQGTWNDWENGGGEYGFEPLFTQGAQVYPQAPFDYGQKWSYTNAPDAEVRAIQWAFWAKKFATEQGLVAQIATSTSMAMKMGDYTRYNLFDKYFRKIGQNQQGATDYSSAHYLINWYMSWGGEIVPADDPTPGREPYYNFLVACSECHQGYQGLSTAYALATGGGGMKPISPGGGDMWLGSVYRQIEMIRWLQSPEGPIAGGVTNSMFDQYAASTDGRQVAKFYGMEYIYSPVWHDPVSNNWVGFQGWGQGRTADLFLEVADKTTALAVAIRPNLEIILDRLVGWFVPEIEWTEDGSFIIPSTLVWTSDSEIPGQTTNAPNLEGVYEFLPSLNWTGQTNGYASFWNASTVPNPNLHCVIKDRGLDLGVAASMAYLLLTYAEGKRLMGKFETTIPNTNIKPSEVYIAARRLLDRSWQYFDGVGICVPEPRTDYNRMADEVYIPPQFQGEMPNGDPVVPGATFISIRTFLKDDPMWPACEAYMNGSGPAPVFRYHRFWAQSEYAISLAAMHRYFKDINDTIEYTI